MLLPEHVMKVRIRFENPLTKEPCFTNMTVTESSSSCAVGEPVYMRLEGYLDTGTAESIKEDGPGIAKRVIFNPPATIAIWKDGSKTVVKCDENDEYNPMYGLALCYMKKAMGNTSRGLNDALRAGRAEMERTKDELVKKLEGEREKEEPACVDLERIRKFLKGKTIIDQTCSAVLCPIKGPYYNTCNYCPYRTEPYGKCCKKLIADIQKIRKEDEEGKKK